MSQGKRTFCFVFRNKILKWVENWAENINDKVDYTNWALCNFTHFGSSESPQISQTRIENFLWKTFFSMALKRESKI